MVQLKHVPNSALCFIPGLPLASRLLSSPHFFPFSMSRRFHAATRRSGMLSLWKGTVHAHQSNHPRCSFNRSLYYTRLLILLDSIHIPADVDRIICMVFLPVPPLPVSSVWQTKNLYSQSQCVLHVRPVQPRPSTASCGYSIVSLDTSSSVPAASFMFPSPNTTRKQRPCTRWLRSPARHGRAASVLPWAPPSSTAKRMQSKGSSQWLRPQGRTGPG